MRFVLTRLALGAAFAISPLAAFAEDIALVLSGSDYRRIADSRASAKVQTLVPVLEDQGFRVFSGRDLDAEDSWELVEKFRNAAKTADRVFVVLAGHLMSTDRDAWLLTRFASNPSDLTIGAKAVPVQPIMDIASNHPGQAIVMIAPTGANISHGIGIIADARSAKAAQGVTLVRGKVNDQVEFAQSILTPDGTSLADLVAKAPRTIRASGFVSPIFPYLSEANREEVADSEAEFWRAVLALDTLEGYKAYLKRFPNGRYERTANAAISDLRSDPARQARKAEEALGLTREHRRTIQHQLSILDHDPRGIDGVFGRGSRAAISSWQRSQGFEVNGFLTGNQIAALEQEAQARARVLAEEAERRRIENDRLDTAYWREHGRDGGEKGLLAYLKAYPDGLFAELAQARLDNILADKRAALAAEERGLWDDTEAAGTVASYRRYLDRYPKGAFADAARNKVDQLNVDDDVDLAAAKAAEKRAVGNKAARLLVEKRLQNLGYKIPKADGTFDEADRRIIRKFQRTRRLPVTGYVSQLTVVHLLMAGG